MTVTNNIQKGHAAVAKNSKIEWCTHTFNPFVGCTKISAACDHCYAEAWAKRTGNPELWAGERRRTSVANWRGPLRWNAEARAAGVRHRVFCASLADVFDNQAPDEWRADLWRLIGQTTALDWLLLTKRPQNIWKMLPETWEDWSHWRSIWLGATVESQAEARRIAHLQEVSAAVRFLSCEPLLEAIEPDLGGISWVICGGESGSQARPMDPAWARRLRDQCSERGVAFFMKQMTRKEAIPDDLLVRQFPTPTRAMA